MVDGHKAPFRMRTKGLGRVHPSLRDGLPVLEGLPRRFGTAQGGGATRYLSNS